MPMKKTWGRIASLSTVVVALAAAAPASAVTTPTSLPPVAGCSAPSFSQPLLGYGDSNYYALAPGGSFDAGGPGWELSGGAAVVGGALDLPSRSQATSPVMCITSDYPTSRLFARNVDGKTQNVTLYTSLYKNGAWLKPKNTGHFDHFGTSWTLSQPLNNKPAGVAGWQQVRFTLAAADKSHLQVDNVWVDPRASR
jgi:hypothetical protein